MRIHVNDQPRDVPEGTSVATLLCHLEVNQPHVAVEVNLQVVPRAEHAATQLREGDRLEVVTLVGGG